jgi:hypothetical protein
MKGKYANGNHTPMAFLSEFSTSRNVSPMKGISGGTLSHDTPGKETKLDGNYLLSLKAIHS